MRSNINQTIASALRCTLLTATLLLGLQGLTGKALAETIRIVALGASDAAGHGVGSAQAWPAQLESILRAKGYDVSVSVNAVPHNTSAQVLARADAAASGARVVVFDTGVANDRKQGISSSVTEANIAQIRAHIRANGAVPIQSAGRTSSNKQADGEHSTVQGHAAIAAGAAAQVIRVIGKSK